jgi:microcystin-dependent protein
MSDQFVGEIRYFAFPRIPTGWLACNGALLSISTYQVLYTLIGTVYGGDGRTSFAVPDLRGRVPLHQGQGTGLTPRVMGQAAGAEAVTLTAQTMAVHTHAYVASTTPGTTNNPSGQVPAQFPAGDGVYVASKTGLSQQAFNPAMFGSTGNAIAHENCAPTLTLSPCIAWAGIFPQQS